LNQKKTIAAYPERAQAILATSENTALDNIIDKNSCALAGLLARFPSHRRNLHRTGPVKYPVMKTPSLLLGSLGLASLLSFTGCVGSGPNTPQGVVGGAALGALAGAIIGNNSGSHNGASGALIGGIAGGVAGGAIGNSLDHQRGTLYTSESEATTTVIVEQPPAPPPPPPRVIIARPHRRDVVWVDGYWAYDGRGRYEWVDGYWATPPSRRRAYVAPHWNRRDRGYVYVQGYWR
jgi:outer membrane lipoprotein SlyB